MPPHSALLQKSHLLCRRWLVLSSLRFCTWPRPKTRQRCLMTQQSPHLSSHPLTWLPCSWSAVLTTILHLWILLFLSEQLCSRSSTMTQGLLAISGSIYPSPCLEVSALYFSTSSFTRRSSNKFRRTKATTLLEELTTMKISLDKRPCFEIKYT